MEPPRRIRCSNWSRHSSSSWGRRLWSYWSHTQRALQRRRRPPPQCEQSYGSVLDEHVETTLLLLRQGLTMAIGDFSTGRVATVTMENLLSTPCQVNGWKRKTPITLHSRRDLQRQRVFAKPSADDPGSGLSRSDRLLSTLMASQSILEVRYRCQAPRNPRLTPGGRACVSRLSPKASQRTSVDGLQVALVS
jgi:hypothetical protein